MMAENCNLSSQECTPCRGGVDPLQTEEISAYLALLGGGWQVQEERMLEKEFRFPDFMSGLGFVNRVGALAEEQGHHPDVFLAWGRVRIQLWTHKIKGLHENDFILAGKIDAL
jgi:4a-hydroxytetrahydrobiopterin dehydratase